VSEIAFFHQLTDGFQKTLSNTGGRLLGEAAG
jgi:hypothetical protein